MTQTVVVTYADADFSANNVGFIDPEPLISLPDVTKVGYFRFGRSLALSLKNKISGGAAAVVSGTPPTINPLSATSVVGSALALPAPLSPAMTIITVHAQEASIPSSQTLGGYGSNSAAAYGLFRQSTGGQNYIANARLNSGTAVSASLAPAGGSRIELLAAVFDVAANQVRLRRPRTLETASAAWTNWGAQAGNHRVLGNVGSNTGAVEGLVHIALGAALTDAQIDAVYESAKTSLAASNIAI